MYNVREINPNSEQEIFLVASRMRKTLEDVLGKEKGESFYSEDWLIDRVKWHLSHERVAKVYLTENEQQEVVAQAIVRLEEDSQGQSFGYFSTVYVAPEYRRKGLARQLVQTVESWCQDQGFPYLTYSTAENNQMLIDLFLQRDYEIILRESEMVQLKKIFQRG